MNNKIKYTFEKIEKILYKQAHKAKKLFPNKYEIDELVNEVWLKGSIQKLDDIKYVASRAYWDMIDYIRNIEGRYFIKKGVKYSMPKYITNMHNIKTGFDQKTDYDFFSSIESKEKSHIELTDNKEELERLLKCLSKKKRIILEKYFLEGLGLVEIGKIFNMKNCSISNSKKKSIHKIRKENNIDVKEEQIMKLKNISLQRLLPLEEILPEYVSDFEINNECAVEEDIVVIRELHQNN